MRDAHFVGPGAWLHNLELFLKLIKMVHSEWCFNMFPGK